MLVKNRLDFLPLKTEVSGDGGYKWIIDIGLCGKNSKWVPQGIEILYLGIPIATELFYGKKIEVKSAYKGNLYRNAIKESINKEFYISPVIKDYYDENSVFREHSGIESVMQQKGLKTGVPAIVGFFSGFLMSNSIIELFTLLTLLSTSYLYLSYPSARKVKNNMIQSITEDRITFSGDGINVDGIIEMLNGAGSGKLISDAIYDAVTKEYASAGNIKPGVPYYGILRNIDEASNLSVTVPAVIEKENIPFWVENKMCLDLDKNESSFGIDTQNISVSTQPYSVILFKHYKSKEEISSFSEKIGDIFLKQNGSNIEFGEKRVHLVKDGFAVKVSVSDNTGAKLEAAANYIKLILDSAKKMGVGHEFIYPDSAEIIKNNGNIFYQDPDEILKNAIKFYDSLSGTGL